MKTNCWLILGTMIAASAIAQDNNTNALPEMPAPVTSPTAEIAPAPAAVDTSAPVVAPVKHKKRAAKKINEPTVTLVPGPASVAVSNVNVRAQAGLKGEFITHLFKDDSVMVLEQINLARHAADEPSQWAKISYPTNAHVWVRAKYIGTNGVVTSKKINLRAGPGENYSVVGMLERGEAVSEVETKDGWMKIEPTTNAYAFVAAMYVQQEAAAPAPATNTTTAPEPEPTPTPVPETQPIAAEQTNATAPAEINNPPPAVAESTPPAPRIVTHEGVVGFTFSPNAPTDFKLYDPSTYQNIDYLYTTAKDLDLKRYVNMRIIVTGVEGLDARWQDTPVITIQRIQVLDTNAVTDIPIKHNH